MVMCSSYDVMIIHNDCELTMYLLSTNWVGSCYQYLQKGSIYQSQPRPSPDVGNIVPAIFGGW